MSTNQSTACAASVTICCQLSACVRNFASAPFEYDNHLLGRRSCEIQRVLLGTSVASSFHTKDDPDSDPMSQPSKSLDRWSSRPLLNSRFAPSCHPGSDLARTHCTTSGPNVPGAFFVFADLFVRKAGRYRLEFSLMKMEPRSLIVGETLPILCTVTSQIFRVFNTDDYDQVSQVHPW